MKIRPLYDRVVVRPLEEDRKSKGGIFIPDSAANEKPNFGEILEIGTGKRDDNGKNQSLAVKKGDKILFGKYAGTEVKVEGETLIVMREEDIMGIVE
jgi:chaperonin GroES